MYATLISQFTSTRDIERNIVYLPLQPRFDSAAVTYLRITPCQIRLRFVYPDLSVNCHSTLYCKTKRKENSAVVDVSPKGTEKTVPHRRAVTCQTWLTQQQQQQQQQRGNTCSS
ncbi:unnamed protein product [Ceratitis capitata]|uniref:(Mediterranean fruit fly) hypothetical protein n=1 Tax=Ceratitis capitata TaxID=7213 RepID=A0A811V5P1_CERCA|nr:unnamed protein product [Ceratitis capitata]